MEGGSLKCEGAHTDSALPSSDGHPPPHPHSSFHNANGAEPCSAAARSPPLRRRPRREAGTRCAASGSTATGGAKGAGGADGGRLRVSDSLVRGRLARAGFSDEGPE